MSEALTASEAVEILVCCWWVSREERAHRPRPRQRHIASPSLLKFKLHESMRPGELLYTLRFSRTERDSEGLVRVRDEEAVCRAA